MTLDIYQVDAFSAKLFGGNPAAIIPLEAWLSDDIMQQIAQENNLSETAYFVKEGEHFHIRWFTPAVEVALCGHATLATAHVIYEHLGFKEDQIKFMSKSGELVVKKRDGLLEMNFPATSLSKTEIPAGFLDQFNIKPSETLKAGEDFFLIFDSEEQIKALVPNFSALKKIKSRGIICTAPGTKADFVSRFFAPAAGIDEDPVTGSAHTSLIPYWAKKLAKNSLYAEQISKRKGELHCQLIGDRVLIAGEAISYLQGKINI
ncbi:PhzF family phenazine biosynthesis protein [Arcticibacterium luteifluviistationis]|uniref:Isomerase n=1 Tax=Arcticibacterium luteifluviistationis TaxID=1784714 RepID=A0A2Z4GBZ9_9BACT|nr:PhzF family phenazine biosynthesis protein [Arcticibacterium luteifluviistationis]AWV98681.1 isomerase [Arcticibacterium luteifluviistationis]